MNMAIESQNSPHLAGSRYRVGMARWPHLIVTKFGTNRDDHVPDALNAKSEARVIRMMENMIGWLRKRGLLLH